MHSLSFQNIRSINGSQQDGFEELVCQLARAEYRTKGKRFIRKGRPDAGVECIWQFNNGTEWGWQAKFFTRALDNTQWAEVESSVKKALETHPKLKRYYIAIPVDAPDARIPGKKSMLDKWNEKVKKWEALAETKGMNVNFIYWGHHELLRMLSEKQNEGKIYFWFNQSELTERWFEENISNATQTLLDKRYTPKVNFELPIAKVFNGLYRDYLFKSELDQIFEKVMEKYRWAQRNLEDNKKNRVAKSIISKTIRLRDACLSLDLSDIEQIDFASLAANIEQLIDDCSKYRGELYRLQSKEIAANPDQYRHSIPPRAGELAEMRNYTDSLSELLHFIRSTSCQCVNEPYLLLTGKAGMGKSHLIADIVNDRYAKGYLNVLLLGQHFVTSENPWTQILHSQLRLQINEHVFLGALNAKAESTGKRIVIFIDAINEGNGIKFWPDYLKSFVRTIRKYEWLGLVISLRSSYEKLIAPESDLPQSIIARLQHKGFEGSEYEATKHFFRVYDIEQPNIPLLEPEFQNPLFLKLLCQGLQNKGLHTLPEGFWGISQVLNFFVESINIKLAGPNYYHYPESIDVVYKTIQALIKWKVENDQTYIPYEEAFLITKQEFTTYSTQGGNYLESLISEGVLSEDIFYDDSGNADQGIYLAYERFEDNLQAAAIIEKYVSIKKPEDSFQSGYLYQITRTDYECSKHEGLIEALSIQLPEKIGKELYELAAHARNFVSIADAFVESILWRRSNTFSEKQIDYINEVVLSKVRNNKFWETIIAISSRPNHYYNAERFHENLIGRTLTERDAWWTIFINDKYEYPNSVRRIIDWCWSPEDKSYASSHVIKLTSLVLGWFHTSCNRHLRDAATKALISLLENRVTVVEEILRAFQDVDDPYVLERIYCAAYGVVLRSKNREGLQSLCEYIFTNIFDKGEVYPHALLRDYARQIIEFAIRDAVVLKIDADKIRPPYKSSVPKKFPTNAELDKKHKVKYGTKKYKPYHGGADEILSSMTTEYGRGTAQYGDFGRYVFESALNDFDINANQWSNWAVQRIFEMGYDVKKHGEFDARGQYRVEGRTHAERLGKKYQWMVLHESLARISDNFPLMDNSDWNEKKFIPYQGPWQLGVRDIDPSVLLKKTQEQKESTDVKWWFPVVYEPWTVPNKDWMASTTDFPDPASLIMVKDVEGKEWVVLETDPDWLEPKPLGEDRWLRENKRLAYHISAYLADATELKKISNWCNANVYYGSNFPKPGTWGSIFYKEYYWAAAYRHFQSPYYEGDVKRRFRDERFNTIGEVYLSTCYYNWSKEFDCSKEEQINIKMPSEILWRELKLEHGEIEGCFVSPSNETICFDPSVTEKTISCLLIRKDALLSFLKKNNLCLFWTLTGHKQVLGSHAGYRDNICCGFYSLDSKGKLAGKFRTGLKRN